MAATESGGWWAWLRLMKDRTPNYRENPAFEPGFWGNHDSDPRWEKNPIFDAEGFW